MSRHSVLKSARAAFLAFHLIAIVVLSLPGPRRLSQRGVWESPQNQAQFRELATKIRRIGFDVTPRLVERHLWQLTLQFLEFRRLATLPFQEYESWLGFRQSWRMFSNPQTRPASVEIAIDRGEGFEIISDSAGSASFRGADLTHHRLRKLFGRMARTRHNTSWVRFARWLKQHVQREYPTATKLRVRQLRATTPPPFEEARPISRVENERIFELRGSQ